MTHCRIFEAAGEGNATALPTGVQIRAVEVHVQVPVVRPVSSTARPLRDRDRKKKVSFGEHADLLSLMWSSDGSLEPRPGQLGWVAGFQRANRG